MCVCVGDVTFRPSSSKVTVYRAESNHEGFDASRHAFVPQQNFAILLNLVFFACYATLAPGTRNLGVSPWSRLLDAGAILT